MSPVSSAQNPERQRLLTASEVRSDLDREVFGRTVRLAVQALDARFAAICFLGEEEVRYGAVAGADETPCRTENSFCRAIVDAGAPTAFRDLNQDPSFRSHPLVEQHPSLRVIAGVPLRIEGPDHLSSTATALGALFVGDTRDRSFSATDRTTLTDLAASVESTLERRVHGQRHPAILEHATDAFMALDSEWRITHVNARTESLLQRTAKEMLGENIWEAYPAAKNSPFASKVRHVADEREPSSMETYYPPLETWFSVRMVPVDGGITLFFDDVTERRERAELLDSINANITEGLFRSTPSDGLVYANSAFADMFGYDGRDQILDLSPSALYADPADRVRFTQRLEAEETVRGMEFEFQRRDGSRFWGIVSCTVVYDDEENVRYYDGAVVDITDRKEREKRLRLLERAVNNATEAIMMVERPPNSEPQIRYVNEAFTDVTGYASDEAVGQSPRILEGPATDPTLLRPLFDPPDDASSISGETVNYRGDGDSILLQWNLAPVRKDEDATSRWIALLRNVTKRRRMEQELREREQKVEALYAEMGDLLQASRREQVASHIEDLVIDTLGYPLNAVRFAEDGSLVPARVSGEIQAHMPERPVYAIDDDNAVSNAFRAGETRVYDDVRTIDDAFSRGDARATAYVPIGTHGIISVARLEATRLDPFDVRLLEILTRNAAVVLERIQREDRQRRSIERIDTLRDVSQSILSASSADAVARATLKRLSQLVPYERASVVEFDREAEAAPILAVDDPDAPAPKFEDQLPLSHFRTDGQHLVEDLRYVRKIRRPPSDPVERNLLTAGVHSYLNVPLRAEDTVLGALNLGAKAPAAYTDEHLDIAREVADMLAVALRQARYRQDLIAAKREAEEMNRLKSAFLANMSHEIRTPLTSIIGFTDVLEDHDLGEADHIANLIAKSGEQLLETIDSVLDLSKLEAGSVQPTLEEMDVAEQTRETIELVRTRADEADIALHADMPDRPVKAKLDRGALRRILHNLLSNAIKFTDTGGSVTVRVEETAEHVVLEVEDTGVGIDPSFMPHLFNAFEREDAGTGNDGNEGTGLGLAVTRRLVDLLDGSIDVESSKGDGTCFTIHLPRFPGTPA